MGVTPFFQVGHIATYRNRVVRLIDQPSDISKRRRKNIPFKPLSFRFCEVFRVSLRVHTSITKTRNGTFCESDERHSTGNPQDSPL